LATIVESDLKYIHSRFDEKDQLEGKKILITGCAGFLGFYFMHYLARHGQELGLQEVIGLDNFKIQRPEWLSQLSDEHAGLVSIHDFDVVKGDLGGIQGAEDADYVIHLASIASPTFYRKYPVETFDANVWGLRKLLDFYRSTKLSGLLYFSSSEVYGDPAPEAIPTDESYYGNVATIGPRACYDESKRFGETICYVYNNEFSMPISIVRPFNNYGPGMSPEDKRVPADFAKSVMSGEDITIFSDGSPTRTFCYVTDAIVGYLKALAYEPFDYFNIGIESPEIRVIDLAQIYVDAASTVLGTSHDILIQAPPEANYLTHNPNRRCPDIKKARQLLNFAPEISVEQGVERFIRYLVESQGTA